MQAENLMQKSAGGPVCCSHDATSSEAGAPFHLRSEMDIEKLLERVIAQNETIIRQNVELLLILSVLAEKDSEDRDESGSEHRDRDVTPATRQIALSGA